MNRTVKIIGAIFAGVVIFLGALCAVSVIVTGDPTPDRSAIVVPADSTSPGATVGKAGAEAAKKVVPTSKTPGPKVTPTIDGDNIVHVGEDVVAGTYRVVVPLERENSCYWMKSSDPEGQNIIDNDLPAGGRPQVTLKKGQWFTTQDCGVWAKTGS